MIRLDDCIVTVIATCDRGDSGSDADIGATNTENGRSDARASATSTPLSTTNGVLPSRTHGRMSTCAVEFPAGNQASGRVPANMWNSRQANEIAAIGTSAKPSPSAAGDDDTYVTQADDCVDTRVYDGQGTPQPPPAAQPERPSLAHLHYNSHRLPDSRASPSMAHRPTISHRHPRQRETTTPTWPSPMTAWTS